MTTIPILGPGSAHPLPIIQANLVGLGATERFLEFAVYAWELAPTRSVQWDLVVAQSALETGYGTSEAFNDINNTAGIKWGKGKPPADAPPIGVKYRMYETLRDGCQDQINLLAVYAGVWVPDMVDPTRNTRLRGIASDSAGLQGTWAEAGHYAASLLRIHRKVFG